MSELELNEHQKAAVNCGPGPKLIYAGPGTGKTRVITARVIKLVDGGIAPEKILALTFSRRAVEEMRQRIITALGPHGSAINVSTFHAFCADILRERAIDAAIDPFFKIASKADTLAIMARITSEIDFEYLKLNAKTGAISELIDFFSRLKEELVTGDELLAYVDDLIRKAGTDKALAGAAKYKDIARAYHFYQKQLSKSGLLDFGDLLVAVLDLFKRREDILKEYQDCFDQVLVDEFQDTNFAQAKLAQILVARHQNLFVVGDDDQSIYRWRGASLSNILDFKSAFPKTKTITLSINYRSTPDIVRAAAAVIEPNKQRIKKKLQSFGEMNGTVDIKAFSSILAEAESIALMIKNLVIAERTINDSVAVLFRSVKGDARPYAAALDRHNVSYSLLSAGSMFKSEAARDLIAWIKVLADPFDEASLARTITAQPFLLSYIDLARTKRDKNVDAGIDALRTATILEPLTHAKVDAWLMKFKILSTSQNQDDLGALAREIIDSIGIRARLLVSDTPDSKRQLTEIKELETIAESFGRYADLPSLVNFSKYLDWLVNLRLDQPALEPIGGVNLLTIHGAKGLEFDHVFLPNLTKAKMPGRNRRRIFEIPDALLKEDLGGYNDKALHEAEARRLFYVGITRARRGLYFSYSSSGKGELLKDEQSLFLTDICDKLRRQPTVIDDETPIKSSRLSSVKNSSFDSWRHRRDVLSDKAFDEKTAATILADDIGRLIHWRVKDAGKKNSEKTALVSGIIKIIDKVIKPEYQSFVNKHITTNDVSSADDISTRKLADPAMVEKNCLSLTVSNLKTYQRCPRQYRYLSVDKISGPPSGARELGTIIHQVMQQWHAANSRENAQVDQLIGLFETGLEHLPRSRRPAPNHIDKIRKALNAYYVDFMGQTSQPQFFEKLFSLEIDGHSIKGRVDRVDLSANGDYELIDYKTGRVAKPVEIRNDLQLPLYYLGARDVWGLRPGRLIYYFVVEEEKRDFIPTEDTLETAIETVKEITDNISNGLFQPEPEYMKCRFCDYSLLCPAVERTN